MKLKVHQIQVKSGQVSMGNITDSTQARWKPLKLKVRQTGSYHYEKLIRQTGSYHYEKLIRQTGSYHYEKLIRQTGSYHYEKLI